MNHSNVKPTTKKRAKAVLSVFLVVAILIAGAYAFLSATDSKTNVFTVGNVKIELWEDFNGKTYNGQQTPDPTEDIIPGQTIDKRPYIKNTGNNNAWMFMAVGVPTASDEDIASNTFPNGVKIEVKAFGIQENYNNANTAVDTWKSYFTADKAASTLGTIVTNTEKELFTLNEPANSGWTKLDDTYRVDGYVYHIFALDTVASPATNEFDGFTTAPFESVTFNEEIGKTESVDSDTISLEGNPIVSLNVLSDDCILTLTDGTVYKGGEVVPESYVPTTGDKFENSDYVYVYNKAYYQGSEEAYSGQEWDAPSVDMSGWGVRIKDDSKTTYRSMYENLAAQPVRFADNTFAGCKNLITSPAMPNEIVTMYYTFDGCSKLTDFSNIPAGVKTIEGCFYDCESLKKIPHLPEGLINTESAFCGCTALQDVSNIPSSVVNIAEFTFSNCSGLTSVEIPDSVTSIGDSAFSDCTGLTKITLSRSITKIETQAFGGCSNLASVVFRGQEYTDETSLINALQSAGVDCASGSSNSAFYKTALS